MFGGKKEPAPVVTAVWAAEVRHESRTPNWTMTFTRNGYPVMCAWRGRVSSIDTPDWYAYNLNSEFKATFEAETWLRYARKHDRLPCEELDGQYTAEGWSHLPYFGPDKRVGVS